MDKLTVVLSECPADAVLAEDVLNENGVIVLKAGTPLTETKIHSLQNYGVESVSIENINKVSAAELEAIKNKISEHIDKRMRHCEMTDEMLGLKDVLIRFHCRGYE